MTWCQARFTYRPVVTSSVLSGVTPVQYKHVKVLTEGSGAVYTKRALRHVIAATGRKYMAQGAFNIQAAICVRVTVTISRCCKTYVDINSESNGGLSLKRYVNNGWDSGLESSERSPVTAAVQV